MSSNTFPERLLPPVKTAPPEMRCLREFSSGKQSLGGSGKAGAACSPMRRIFVGAGWRRGTTRICDRNPAFPEIYNEDFVET